MNKTAKVAKVAIIGATGYSGQELVRLLLQHGQVEIKAATSNSYAGKEFSSVYPNHLNFTDWQCSELHFERLCHEMDLIFIALPHGHTARLLTSDLLKQSKVIDLGADFRLKNANEYKQWYGIDHVTPELLKQSVYGLPELNRDQIKAARLIANPGCYATCAILSLTPLLKNGLVDPTSIIVDAKSGVSGAGRSQSLAVHYNECNETLKAYNVGSHRHTPEIEEALASFTNQPLRLSFTPHLVPMNRGILVTAYASLIEPATKNALLEVYKQEYGQEAFIRLYDGSNERYPLPETRWVKGSNFCDIGLTVDQRTNRVIVVGALDNLVKGAAGQAIQNMNLAFGFDETAGLKQLPIFPA